MYRSKKKREGKTWGGARHIIMNTKGARSRRKTGGKEKLKRICKRMNSQEEDKIKDDMRGKEQHERTIGT